MVLDRYYTSNLIHQGAKLEKKEIDDFVGWLHRLEFEILKIPKPDLIIYLHLKAELAYDLITVRGRGHDGHDTIEHLKKAEQRCLDMAKKLNWVTIECSAGDQPKKIDDIANNVWQEVAKLLDIN